MSFLGAPGGSTESKSLVRATGDSKEKEVKAPPKPVYETIEKSIRLNRPDMVAAQKAYKGGEWSPNVDAWDFSNGAAFTPDALRSSDIRASDAKSSDMATFFAKLADTRTGNNVNLQFFRSKFAVPSPYVAAGGAVAGGRSMSPTRRGPDISRLTTRASSPARATGRGGASAGDFKSS